MYEIIEKWKVYRLFYLFIALRCVLIRIVQVEKNILITSTFIIFVLWIKDPATRRIFMIKHYIAFFIINSHSHPIDCPPINGYV